MGKRRIPAPSLPIVATGENRMLEPHLDGLTDKERAFVRMAVEGAGRNLPQAAETAGFRNYLEPMANRRVVKAIRDHADLTIQAAGLLAASRLVDIAADAEHKDTLKANLEILNRVGLAVEDKKRIIIEDTRTPDQIRASVEALALQAGLDPKKLLGQGAVIEGQFTEVEEGEDENG
jgi:hypothetical protein